jgi:hypothetical protein
MHKTILKCTLGPAARRSPSICAHGPFLCAVVIEEVAKQ